MRNRNQALDQAASDLVNVLDSVKIPIIIVDGALRVRRFTPLAREISTLIPSDVGRPIDDVKFTVRIEKLPDKIRESLESMMPKEWEVQGDDQRWLRMQIRPYRGTDNRLDGAVLSFIDVDVLKRALQSAEFARDYARGIVATVQTALIVLDSKDRIISLNRAFQEKFNAFASTADGASFFALADGAFRVDALVAAIERSLATRSPFCDLEIQIELPGTGRQTLSFSGRPLSWEGGSPALLLAIEDITERRQHERERAQLLASTQQARIEGERANRAKDLFLATLSHELRTPLSAILMSAELLKQVASADSRVERASAAITRAVSTQARLIDDLLDISRIVSGKLRLHLQAVDLTEIVRNAIDMARTTAEAKGLALQVEVADKLRPLYGDPARLQQVVANLLNNSIKFTPPGGKIAVSLEALDGQARIRITDTGMGIPAELLPRLFDRFVQADSEMTRAHGGLGLGLAIVRYLVEVHGGNVQAESPGPGQGATFQVLLPFAPQTEPTSATAVPAQGTVARSIEHVRVLLIDDEDDTREAFSAALGALGAEVHAARSAAEGLGVLREWKPQVILCDIAMPSEDGYSFARKLRSLSRQQGGQTPAAALTALAGDEDRRRALDAGFQMHLAKPIDSARLAAAIGTLAAWPQPLGLPAEPAP